MNLTMVLWVLWRLCLIGSLDMSGADEKLQVVLVRLFQLPERKEVGPAEASAALGAVGAAVSALCRRAQRLHL
jgi:hypothetical protein